MSRFSNLNLVTPGYLGPWTIGGIERGERSVALRNIESIALTLGISLADLMEGL